MFRINQKSEIIPEIKTPVLNTSSASQEPEVFQAPDLEINYEQYVIDELNEEIENAKNNLNSQNEKDGWVNKIFNFLKEIRKFLSLFVYFFI